MQKLRLSELTNVQVYNRRLEFSTLLALLLMTTVFYSFQKNDKTSGKRLPPPKITIKVIDVPQTDQLKKPPKPVTPSILVPEEEDDEVLGNVPIDTRMFNPDLDKIIPVPDFNGNEVIDFYKLEKRPKLLHMSQPVYPDLAKKAHIQGTVTVQVLLSRKGRVLEARILKSVPMLDQAALSAAKKCIFTPGKQRDRFVRVRVSIPFVFKLTN